MKTIKLRKILLCYTYREHDQEKTGWHDIHSQKRPNYKEAMTLLKRSLHSKEATKTREVIKVKDLYDKCL